MKLIYTNKKHDASNDGFECVKEGGPGQPPRPREMKKPGTKRPTCGINDFLILPSCMDHFSEISNSIERTLH
jgi:hypothetical protein